MSEHPPQKPSEDAENAIRRNLQSFLHPSAPSGRQGAEDAALQLRLAQMELANRMRLGQNGPTPKAVPMSRRLPPGGFGSAQGIMHMKRGDFGKKASEPTLPSQQVPEPSPVNEVIDVPAHAEVKKAEPGKRRSRLKKFQNPSL